MKTDLEAAMLELDKIMRANELTVAVTAALPAMVVAGALTYVGWRTILPHPPNVRTAAGPARVALAELEQVRSLFTVAPSSGCLPLCVGKLLRRSFRCTVAALNIGPR